MCYVQTVVPTDLARIRVHDPNHGFRASYIYGNNPTI